MESEEITGTTETENECSGPTEEATPKEDTTTKLDSVKTDIEQEQPQIQTPVKKLEKINIILKPVGDAPILKQKLWAVDPDKPIAGIIQFIRKYLKITTEGGLFVYVNQAFAPSPDQLVRNLYECFGSDGKLVLHYSTITAWG